MTEPNTQSPSQSNTLRSSSHGSKPLPVREDCSDLIFVRAHTSRIIDLLKRLTRHRPTHVSAPSRRQQRRIAQVINPLLPDLCRLWRRVHILDPLAIDEINRVADPAALDFSGGGPVGEESWSVRPVQVEHIGVAGDCGAQVGVGGGFPFVF